jgi:AraC family transcriptional regulator of adaptative response/methylated-DNA-[protein]-cysteine methyltransferase
MQRACQTRDASYDGIFFVAIRTTGIVCKPSCPARPLPGNREFFATLREAITAGYRPCKRCKPELVNGRPPEWIRGLLDRVTSEPDERITKADLHEAGLTPERVRRWFKENHGMTFAAWQRGQKISQAQRALQRGAPLDDVILGHGYGSHSGFRDAFRRVFGAAPGQSREGNCLRAALLETPIGPMLAAADDQAIVYLEFASQYGLEKNYATLRKRSKLPVIPGTSGLLTRLKTELEEYFQGVRREFTLPLKFKGTAFQESVWRQLQRIPFGRTASYGDLAKRIGQPTAVRAVAQANARNPLAILVPCHRVIGSDGKLSGYAGGVWRKRLLLELERGGKIERPL